MADGAAMIGKFSLDETDALADASCFCLRGGMVCWMYSVACGSRIDVFESRIVSFNRELNICCSCGCCEFIFWTDWGVSQQQTPPKPH